MDEKSQNINQGQDLHDYIVGIELLQLLLITIYPHSECEIGASTVLKSYKFLDLLADLLN